MYVHSHQTQLAMWFTHTHPYTRPYVYITDLCTQNSVVNVTYISLYLTFKNRNNILRDWKQITYMIDFNDYNTSYPRTGESHYAD